MCQEHFGSFSLTMKQDVEDQEIHTFSHHLPPVFTNEMGEVLMRDSVAMSGR